MEGTHILARGGRNKRKMWKRKIFQQVGEQGRLCHSGKRDINHRT
jgi:hypothetical protein